MRTTKLWLSTVTLLVMFVLQGPLAAQPPNFLPPTLSGLTENPSPDRVEAPNDGQSALTADVALPNELTGEVGILAEPYDTAMSPEVELFYRENGYRTPYGYNEWFPEFKMFRPGFTGPYAIEHPIIPRLIKIPGRNHLILIESPEYFRAEHARYGNGFQPRYYGVRGNFDVGGGW